MVYTPTELGIKLPSGGFQQGAWYNGRQYWNGTLSDPNTIHPESNQQGAGNPVSQEVIGQSAAAQGKTTQELNTYFSQEAARTPTNAGTTGSVPGVGTDTGIPGSGTGVPGAGILTPDVINLPDLYNTLFESSGISALQSKLSEAEKEYVNAKATINDNSLYGEATRLGRLAKLEQQHNGNTAALRNEIAMKQADIETRLNLQTKQFDINSQAAQQALSQFNALLSMGALNNASGADIAALTKSTGISSDMIQSAISYAKKKDQQTQVITSTNDAGVVTVSVIDQNTGALLKQTSLGAIGNAQNGRAPSQAEIQQQYIDYLKQDSANGAKLSQVFAIYSGYLSPDTIYQIYNANSKYGPDKGDISALAKYGVTQPSQPTGY